MKKGFTIMELLVTISLLLLVAVLIVPNIMKMSDSVKQTFLPAYPQFISVSCHFSNFTVIR